MENVRSVAFICIGRAVFFGALAIGCVMLSFAFHPVASFRAGAILTLIMSAILLWFARTAPSRKPKDTEVWIHLDKKTRPMNDHARQAFATIMQDVYEIFAGGAFKTALGLFVVSLCLQLIGVDAVYR